MINARSRTVKTALVWLGVASPLVAQSAFAQSVTERTTPTGPSEVFGAKRELAISSDAALTIQSASTSGDTPSTTTIQLEPAADYFVAQNISIGGFLGFNYSKTGDNHSDRFAIGPRVGYNLGLSDMLSVWPRIGLSYATTSTTVSVPSPTVPASSISSTASANNLALNVFVPLMVHPVKHFFVGFGPFVDTDLTGDIKTTVFGGKLTIGGWL